MMALRISLLKRLDSFLGHLLVPVAALIPPRGERRGAPGSILLIRPGGIGDAVLLIPAIRALRSTFPAARITVLAERRNAALFRLCPEVNNVLLYDRPGGLFATLCGHYDAVIDTEQWHRLSAVTARLTRAPLLIGYATNERSRLFTHPISYFHDDYEVEGFLRLLAPLGIEPDPVPERFLVVPGDAEQQGGTLLAPLDGRPFVTIFPGASIPERRWGVDRFRRVAEMLADSGISVAVVGGKDDRKQGEVIVAGGAGLNLAGRTSLAETAAVIRQSVLLLSGDSGLLHIAAGLGKPTVGLFGPGRAKKWAPRGGRHVVINKALPCSPCTTFGTTPPCPINARCMAEITPDEVFNATMMLLTATGALPSSCCKREWIEVAGAR
jgi:ADP-heptose:LPS heptosyltransferase